MSDQIEVRAHGQRGVKRHAPVDEAIAASPSPVLQAPAEYDATYGRTKYAMQGNATLPNCFFAARVHSRTVQGTLTADTFVEGFVEDAEDAGATLYREFLESIGQAFPGDGTDPYQGTTFLLKRGDWKYAGVLGPSSRLPDGTPYFEPLTIKEAIYDFQGGVIFLLALDADAEQEFDDNQPWGTQSTTPDQSDGHAVSGVKYQQGNPITTCITWAALEGMLEEFDINCIEGLVLSITDGFILKNGQAAADDLVSKWQLQTSPTLAAAPPGEPDSPAEAPPGTPTPTEPAEGLLGRADSLVRDVLHVAEMAIKRVPEQDILAALEQILETYTKIP